MKRERNYKKKYLAIFAGLMLMVLAIGFGFRTYASAAVTGTVTASTLFVRTGPSTEYPKVQVNGKAVFLSRGDSVAISYGSNGWYYVTASFEGTKVNGYVSAAYVLPIGTVPTAAPTSTPKPTSIPNPTSTPRPASSVSANEVVTSGFPRNGTVTAGTLNVRSSAGTTATIVGKLSKNTVVKIQGVKTVNNEYWYQISYTQSGVTRTGYVSSKYIKPEAVATATPTPRPTSTPGSGTTSNEVITSGFPRTGTITTAVLNVRSGVGTDSPVIATVTNGSAVIVQNAVQSASGNYWYQITFYQDGAPKSGYISSKYVELAAPTAAPTPTATPVPTATPTLAIDSTASVVAGTFPRTGTVTASRLNVRTNAGTSYEAVAAIINTTKVSILSAKKDASGNYWYQISFTRDGVKQTGYVHSDYIAVDALAATATPVPTLSTAPTATSAPAATPTPTNAPASETTVTPTLLPTVTPVPTATPTPAGEPVNKNEIDDFFAAYYYEGLVRTSSAVLYSDPTTDAEQIMQVENNVQLIVTSQALDGINVWYRVALKNDGQMVYGYMLSGDVNLNSGMPITAQLIEDRIRLKDMASSTGSYVKDINGKILMLDIGDVVSVVSENTEDGTKWLEIHMEKDGTVYQGFLKEGSVFFLASLEENPDIEPPEPTETPWTEEPVTSTPTISPNVPTTIPTKKPTSTPKPTVTPVPDSKVLPTPAVLKLSDGNYPINSPGTITGYGTTKNDYDRVLVAYVMPEYPFDLVCDDSEYFISLDGDEILILYDKYKDASNNIYQHIGFAYEGKMYYGYIDDVWVTRWKPGEYEIPDFDEILHPSGSQTGVSNVDFEYYLDQQGFPESYKPYLRELHEQYPKWVFEAYHTGLVWDEVIDEESIAGKNLIPNSKSIEWKSLETGAYDWTKDTFILYDGSTWVTASREAIEYYMDPRNFLNESNIFMFEVLRYAPEYQDEDGVEKILKNTPFQNAIYSFEDDFGNRNALSYAQTFIAAAEYSGVSPYHLATRVKQEVVTSSSTASNSVSGTVKGLEGLYNFYNIGAYHSTVAGGAIANGLKYAKNGASNNDELNDASLIPWTNQYNAIVGGAYILGANYINRGQDTIYLQKFNVTDNSTYYHQYMANVEAPYSESKKTAGAYTNMEDLPIVFSIPIYYDMPAKPVSVPEKAYNPNNWLKSLDLYDAEGNNLQLTPTFNIKSDQVYYLVADSEDSMVQVEAEAVSSSATVIGSGFYGLEYGSNTISVLVCAENGDIREYLIIIVRQE